ncbi:hypothetical protein Taro_034430 [Colocasia esculenta]|uniref:Chloride conductance regulatory protein ICln n=1 Tax=Colocasia esculenta TaxID=4460 RepID=A0A843W0T6_COLES|nr:hypothetical protein [Colocasia esculenta]
MVASGLRHFAEWVGEGTGQPRLDEEGGEQLMHVQPGVSIALGSRPPQSPGTLYITSKRVIWLSDMDNTRGYAVDFLSISLHAVSRDPEAYALPCIYTQIETEAAEDEASEDSDSECTEELDLSKVTEMRLVLSEPRQDEENDWVFGDEQMVVDAEEVANPIGHANGHNDLAHSVLELRINDDRFEDADESEQEAQRHPE